MSDASRLLLRSNISKIRDHQLRQYIRKCIKHKIYFDDSFKVSLSEWRWNVNAARNFTINKRKIEKLIARYINDTFGLDQTKWEVTFNDLHDPNPELCSGICLTYWKDHLDKQQVKKITDWSGMFCSCSDGDVTNEPIIKFK